MRSHDDPVLDDVAHYDISEFKARASRYSILALRTARAELEAIIKIINMEIEEQHKRNALSAATEERAK